MIGAGDAAPAARDMPAEDVLDQCAEAMAIDRNDETSFDSGHFPKPVLLDWLDPGDSCASCHQVLCPGQRTRGVLSSRFPGSAGWFAGAVAVLRPGAVRFT